MDGATALATTLKQREDNATNATWATGTVTGLSGNNVSVNVAGAIITCPYNRTYVPTANDVVVVAGPPGQWFCLGSITPGSLSAGGSGGVGPAGPAGPAGPTGNTILHGSGAPTSGFGNNGDFYLDTAAEALYGPKASGLWPGTGRSLVGPAGPSGSSPMGSAVTVTAASTTNATSTSSTFVSVPGTGVTFIAPPSGKVLVEIFAYLLTATAGNACYMTPVVLSGGTIGSGTSVVAANLVNAISNNNANYISVGRSVLVTGLTAGSTYNAQAYMASNGAVVATTADQSLTVVPLVA